MNKSKQPTKSTKSTSLKKETNVSKSIPNSDSDSDSEKSESESEEKDYYDNRWDSIEDGISCSRRKGQNPGGKYSSKGVRAKQESMKTKH